MESVLWNQTAKSSNGGVVLLVHGKIWARDLFTNSFMAESYYPFNVQSP